MMREAGIVVNDTPKIQVDDPNVTDHSIFFVDDTMRIPYFLNGIFSYFPSTKPTAQIMQECEDIYLLISSRWDAYNTSYAHNKEQILDWQGEMVHSPIYYNPLAIRSLSFTIHHSCSYYIYAVHTNE